MLDEIEAHTKGEKFSYKSKDWENTFFVFYKGEKDKSGSDNIGSRALSELIRIILTTEYILKLRPKDKDEVLRSLLNSNDAENKYDEIPPSEYRKWLSLDKNLEIIDYLKKSLDVLSKNKEKILEGGLPQFGELKNSKYKQKIILFAKISFKVKLEENNISDENDRLFKDWLRVISNLIENTAVDNPDSFKKFIVSTDKLLSKLNNHNLDILECLCAIYDRGEDLKDLDGFNECQLREEIVKAKLISISDEWRVAITDAEKPKNIDSKIAFILKLSGIIDYDFKIINENNFEEFKSFTELVKVLFEIIYNDKKNKFLWQRYLLSCKIHYPYGKTNMNLLLAGSDERDYSWKRFFDFSRYQMDEYLKNVVEKVYDKIIKNLKEKFYGGEELEDLLSEGIDKNLKDEAGNIWNSDYDLFIKYPEAMAYCKEGFFRDELHIGGNIYLIEKIRCTAATSPTIKSYCAYLDAKEEARKNNQKEPGFIIKEYRAYKEDGITPYDTENKELFS